MLPILLALATTVVAPTIQFTTDSVYTKENIITISDVTVDETTGLYTMYLEEDKLLGYCIYDKPETSYIDGLKFDNEYVTDWVVSGVDFSIEHTFYIKTTYTDDAAGMLMAAKDGDWSRLLSNPVILLQLVYYIVAFVSIVIGGFGLVKSKNKKVKTAEEIASAVAKQATVAKDQLVETTIALITPVFEKLNNQNADIIKALVMSKSKDNADTLALLDLLKDSQTGEDITALVERIKTALTELYEQQAKSVKDAKDTIEAIANGTFTDSMEDDGTSI